MDNAYVPPPPCPAALIDKLRTPAQFDYTQPSTHVPGTVWEITAPTGELLLVLLTSQSSNATLAEPFPIFRGIPLSDFVRLAGVGDTIVAVEPGAKIFIAHCWLEGPILPEAFVRSIGQVTPDSMVAVAQACAQPLLSSRLPAITAFRASLFAQFDVLFSVTWERLYQAL